MIKIVLSVLGITALSSAAAFAQSIPAEMLIQEEARLNGEQINEIFQEKIQKISSRQALPEEMRNLLVMQADEVRQFDTDMLKQKMDMKLRHAKERDQMKERLRQDAQNRVKWQLEEEIRFQKNKQKRQEEDEKKRKQLERKQKAESAAEAGKLADDAGAAKPAGAPSDSAEPEKSGEKADK